MEGVHDDCPRGDDRVGGMAGLAFFSSGMAGFELFFGGMAEIIIWRDAGFNPILVGRFWVR